MPAHSIPVNQGPVGIYANLGKPEAIPALLPLLRYLKRRGMQAALVESAAEVVRRKEPSCAADIRSVPEGNLARNCSFIVTYGGDGTLLAAAHEALPHEVPILGVNLGKLGFLADIDADDAIAAVDAVLQGEFRIEKRMTITGLIEGRPEKHHALNDLVINKSGASRVLRIEAHVDGEFLAVFHADGLIVSTPTGSTAYNLATGGPVVVPYSDVIVISTIAAHALTARPIILPGGSRLLIRATAEAGFVMATADGFNAASGVTDLTMEVRKGAKRVRLIKGVGREYFDMLRTKLNWAQDSRMHDRKA